MTMLTSVLLVLAIGQPSAEPSIVQRLIGGEIFGSVSSELRGFVSRSDHEGRLGHVQASIAAEPGYVAELSRDTTLKLVLFGRVDHADSARTHFDVRELWLETFSGDWMVGAGVGKAFWGVTESRHLVDIVNQTDSVENLDGEDKLGQPMLHLSYASDAFGTFDLFLAALQRKRTFPGRKGRLAPSIPISTDDVTYESPLGRGHVDLAARWSHTFGELDIGLSYFYGTSREPVLEPRMSADGPYLAQRYDLIHQAGLDAQWTTGGWLLKLESIGRVGQGDAFAAVTGGFEYTFTQVVASADLGVLLEYSYDGRDNGTFNLFDNEAFGGVRFALNDEQSTQVLIGAAVDVTNGSTFLSVEASRRFFDSFKLAIESRWFFSSDETDPAFVIRHDDYAQIELAYHF